MALTNSVAPNMTWQKSGPLFAHSGHGESKKKEISPFCSGWVTTSIHSRCAEWKTNCILSVPLGVQERLPVLVISASHIHSIIDSTISRYTARRKPPLHTKVMDCVWSRMPRGNKIQWDFSEHWEWMPPAGLGLRGLCGRSERPTRHKEWGGEKTGPQQHTVW